MYLACQGRCKRAVCFCARLRIIVCNFVLLRDLILQHGYFLAPKLKLSMSKFGVEQRMQYGSLQATMRALCRKTACSLNAHGPEGMARSLPTPPICLWYSAADVLHSNLHLLSCAAHPWKPYCMRHSRSRLWISREEGEAIVSCMFHAWYLQA